MTQTMLETYQREQWRKHVAQLRWDQGDHVMISGPTNAGKTTMMRDLAQKRSHVVVFVSKIHDPTFANFKGYKRITEWPKHGPKPWETRLLLWPRMAKGTDAITATARKHRDVFAPALDAIYEDGNRCIVIDETLMFTNPSLIGLARPIEMLHYTGRSHGISMLTLFQRPAWIPKVIYSSVTHAYIARTRDDQDMRRLSDLGGINTRELRVNLSALEKRQDFVYVNPQGDNMPVILNTRN